MDDTNVYTAEENPKRGRGQPKKQLSDAQIAQVEALASVLTKGQIADYMGMSENTLREREKEDERIAEAYKRGKSKAIASVASNLLTQARAGNLTAIIFYLKTQAKWQETSHVDHTTNGESITGIERVIIDEAEDQDAEMG
jgi:flagellar motility protein MotE (MotC chaperone)